MHQPTILILTDEVEFSRLLTAPWQGERNACAFALMRSDLCGELESSTFDLAVVGGVQTGQLAAVTRSLEALNAPALFVCETHHEADMIREAHPRALVLRRYEGWLEAAGLIVAEVLRRCDAQDRAKRAEQANALLDHQATLGRYMLEMRHTLNNALTSVLGNAELLLIEPGCLSADTRSQIEIIRNMALRMNEILRRFTSIEKELNALGKANRNSSPEQQHAAGAAS